MLTNEQLAQRFRELIANPTSREALRTQARSAIQAGRRLRSQYGRQTVSAGMILSWVMLLRVIARYEQGLPI